MEQNRHSTEAIRKLNGLIKDVKCAMFTTAQSDGSLRSRPMVTQQADEDGNLWFFTGMATAKIDEVLEHQQVNISYATPEEKRYISVSGRAEVVHDASKMRDLWSPLYHTYFPKGVEDPDLVLLKVRVSEAEYWDTASNRMQQIAGFVKNAVTSDRAEHEKESAS